MTPTAGFSSIEDEVAEQIKAVARVVRNAKKGRGADGKKKAINGGGRLSGESEPARSGNRNHGPGI